MVGRLLSLRAFDAAGMLRDADVVEGAVAGPVIARMLENPGVAIFTPTTPGPAATPRGSIAA